MEQKNIQREWEQILFCESFVLIVHIFANVCVHTHMYVLWCKMCFLLLVTVKNIECLLPMDLYLNLFTYIVCSLIWSLAIFLTLSYIALHTLGLQFFKYILICHTFAHGVSYNREYIFCSVYLLNFYPSLRFISYVIFEGRFSLVHPLLCLK